jgi:hypothetical protein
MEILKVEGFHIIQRGKWGEKVGWGEVNESCYIIQQVKWGDRFEVI